MINLKFVQSNIKLNYLLASNLNNWDLEKLEYSTQELQKIDESLKKMIITNDHKKDDWTKFINHISYTSKNSNEVNKWLGLFYDRLNIKHSIEIIEGDLFEYFLNDSSEVPEITILRNLKNIIFCSLILELKSNICETILINNFLDIFDCLGSDIEDIKLNNLSSQYYKKYCEEREEFYFTGNKEIDLELLTIEKSNFLLGDPGTITNDYLLRLYNSLSLENSNVDLLIDLIMKNSKSVTDWNIDYWQSYDHTYKFVKTSQEYQNKITLSNWSYSAELLSVLYTQGLIPKSNLNTLAQQISRLQEMTKIDYLVKLYEFDPNVLSIASFVNILTLDKVEELFSKFDEQIFYKLFATLMINNLDLIPTLYTQFIDSSEELKYAIIKALIRNDLIDIEQDSLDVVYKFYESTDLSMIINSDISTENLEDLVNIYNDTNVEILKTNIINVIKNEFILVIDSLESYKKLPKIFKKDLVFSLEVLKVIIDNEYAESDLIIKNINKKVRIYLPENDLTNHVIKEFKKYGLLFNPRENKKDGNVSIGVSINYKGD